VLVYYSSATGAGLQMNVGLSRAAALSKALSPISSLNQLLQNRPESSGESSGRSSPVGNLDAQKEGVCLSDELFPDGACDVRASSSFADPGNLTSHPEDQGCLLSSHCACEDGEAENQDEDDELSMSVHQGRPGLRSALPRIEEEEEGTPRVHSSEPAKQEAHALAAGLRGIPEVVPAAQLQDFDVNELFTHLLQEVAGIGKRMDVLERLVSMFMRETAYAQGLIETKISSLGKVEAVQRIELQRSLSAALDEERDARYRDVTDLRQALNELRLQSPGKVSLPTAGSVVGDIGEGMVETSSWRSGSSNSTATVPEDAVLLNLSRLPSAELQCGLRRQTAAVARQPKFGNDNGAVKVTDAAELEAMSKTLRNMRTNLNKDLSDAKAAASLAELQVVGAANDRQARKAAELLTQLESHVKAAGAVMDATQIAERMKAASDQALASGEDRDVSAPGVLKIDRRNEASPDLEVASKINEDVIGAKPHAGSWREFAES